MNSMTCVRMASCSLVVVAGWLTVGCGESATKGPAGSPPAASVPAADDHTVWWCAEHGVPEGVCAQCNAKVAAEYQKKGDWCKEHNRPESQCFVCSPDRAEKFAAEYEAKYGTKPPQPAGM